MKKNLIIIVLSLFFSWISHSAYAGGIDDYTRLIIHSNTTDMDIFFEDSSFEPHPISVHGDVRHSTNQAMFGSSSIYFDGDGDYLQSPNHIDWCFDDGDFTIDLWINPVSFPFYIMEFGEDPSGENSSYYSVPWRMVAGVDYIQFIAGTEDAGYIVYTAATAIPSWAWTHVAIVRSGNTLMIFVNGVRVLSESMDFSIRCNVHWPLKIGKSVIGETPLYASGYMDEIRISKGIARWAEDFTPPEEPYQMDAFTDVSLRYSESTLVMDLRLGTSEPATWENSISIGTSMITLYSGMLPVIDPPIAFSVQMPIISGLGTVGILSTLSTPDDGITSSDWDTVFTGPTGEGAPIPERKEMRKSFRKCLPKGTLLWSKYGGNPVLDIGAPGEWDDEGVLPGTVIKDGGLYKMWYTGQTEDLPNQGIGYATSPDGITWTKYGSPVLTAGSGWDSRNVFLPSVMLENGTYKMWYTARDAGSFARIGYAESPDGIHWTKYGKVLENNVAYPDVHKNSEGYEMWYGDIGGLNHIKYATSTDGIHWGKKSSPYFSGDPGAVLEDGEDYKMWYQRDSAFRYAISSDPIHWEDKGIALGNGPAGAWDETVGIPVAVILEGNMYKMWYAGHDGEHFRVGYATAPIIDLLNND